MGTEKITCYKLCYLLGVSEEELERDFPVESRVHHQLGFIGDSEARDVEGARVLVELWRTMCSFYETRSAEQIAKLKSKAAQASIIVGADVRYQGKWFVGQEQGIGSGPNEASEYLAWMNHVALCYDGILYNVWKNAGIEITVDVFRRVTEIRTFTNGEMAKYQFVKKHTNRIYGLYFVGDEVLNVAIGAMLSGDAALRDRLSLFSGLRLFPAKDKSVFGNKVREYYDSVYLTKDRMERFHMLALLSEGTEPSKFRELYRTISELVITPEVRYVTVCEIKENDLTALPVGTLVFGADANRILALAKSWKHLNFAITLPTFQRVFKQLSKRVWDNVYMLDKRRLK